MPLIRLTFFGLLLWTAVCAADLPKFEPTGPVVFTPADVPWAEALRERGAILQTGHELRLYFTGYDGTRAGLKRVGLATSRDGGRTWVARPRPVSPAGLWTEDPFVLRHEGRYQMFAEGRGDQAHRLSSADGIDWTSHGPLDVRLTSDEPIPAGPYGTPTVLHHGEKWHLFYERRDAGVWLATSDDLSVWTNVSDEPVLSPGPAEWDEALIALNQILEYEGRFYAFYHGTSRREKPRLWAVGVAVSDDLRNWQKFGGNPITPPAANVSSGTVVRVAGRPVLFTTHGVVRRHVAESRGG